MFVAVVNPAVMDGHSTSTPDQLGDERDAVSIKAEPGEDGRTADGLVVLDVTPGKIDGAVANATPLGRARHDRHQRQRRSLPTQRVLPFRQGALKQCRAARQLRRCSAGDPNVARV